MLDMNFIRNNLDFLKQKTISRGMNFNEKEFIGIDKTRRELITEIETLRSEKKKISREIGILKKEQGATADLEKRTVGLSEDIGRHEKRLIDIEQAFQDFMLNIPNIIDDTVPLGTDASANRVIREWGEKTAFDFDPLPHWELGEKNGFLDLPRAAKISGSRFALYFDTLAKLERTLINFMLDTHTGENGYTEVIPPFLVNDESLIGTGNLPKFREDLFKVEDHNLYLVPTAEVPLTNIHRGEMLDEKDLPLSYVAYTPCFRSEAGSHGKDVRGIIRQHQFNKVELLKFTAPEHSDRELENLTRHAEMILQKLELPYRVVLLCSGDISFSSRKTYDIEVWMPTRQDYMEISSCSNFGDFQARRARIKCNFGGEKQFVHTLNGSGLALGRTVAAIMENYQKKDGKIRIPGVLREFFPGRTVL